MSNQTKKGVGRSNYFSNYKAAGKMQSNRKKKLERQLKLQPNNKNLPIALKDIRYRRATPKNPFWSASMIATARLLKEFGGRVNIDVFSVDEKKRTAALMERSKYAQLPVAKPKGPQKREPSMFSIEARLANGRNIAWSS